MTESRTESGFAASPNFDVADLVDSAVQLLHEIQNELTLYVD